MLRFFFFSFLSTGPIYGILQAYSATSACNNVLRSLAIGSVISQPSAQNSGTGFIWSPKPEHMWLCSLLVVLISIFKILISTVLLLALCSRSLFVSKAEVEYSFSCRARTRLSLSCYPSLFLYSLFSSYLCS